MERRGHRAHPTSPSGLGCVSGEGATNSISTRAHESIENHKKGRGEGVDWLID